MSTTQEPTPLMRQYWDVKTQYSDALLFFRLGDFYELFDSDAETAARELDITLTGRQDPTCDGGRVPMAGVPVRSAQLYLSRLLDKGYSIAICEQVGTPGTNSGPMERCVTRVLTPGTVLESDLLPERRNNYLVAIVSSAVQQNSRTRNAARNASTEDAMWGLAYVDASCGEFFVTELTESQVHLEIARLAPAELLACKKILPPSPDRPVPAEVPDLPEGLEGNFKVVARPSVFFHQEPARPRIMQMFGVATLEGFGCESMPLAIGAAGGILEYLERTQVSLMPRFAGISTYNLDGLLVLDKHTRANLEINETARSNKFAGSLLWVLDKTRTGMGARTLRKWLNEPLCSIPAIYERQEAIAQLVASPSLTKSLQEQLSHLTDLERLGVRVGSATADPRDLLALKQSLETIPSLVKLMASYAANCTSPYLRAITQVPPDLPELLEKLSVSIAADCSRELTQGNIFVPGYNPQLDEIRSLLNNGQQWLNDFQRAEVQRTGIKSLKVGFNSTFGYYIEVSHANRAGVPGDYIRKQTLTNAERYITPELKDHEVRVLNAEKNRNEMEYKLFVELRRSLTPYGLAVQKMAQSLAATDVLACLAEVAREYKYVRPEVNDTDELTIVAGRHPVLERILPTGRYVSNDTQLTAKSSQNQLIILTGPNMSGKSSYLRQVAHIVILAQMGSFVPAQSACIGIVDRIFTRIGAVDDLSGGQSTFLVEMSETSQCCRLATPRSLILLDEVGRGTSTYDGVAIAWAVAEYLAVRVKARTIFATHYHELNGLAVFFPQIENYQVLVEESGGNVEFLRQVVRGGASRSFGVQVAKMSGLPSEIVERAMFIMGRLERAGAAGKLLDPSKPRNVIMDEALQLSLFEQATVENASTSAMTEATLI